MAESVALKGMESEDKRSFMLDKSYEVLAEVGYNRITLDMVADKAGVSKGTISYYFKNKEKLMAETYVHIIDLFLTNTEERVIRTSDPKQMIVNYIDALWFYYWENPKYPEIFKVYTDLWFHGMHSNLLYDVTNDADERIYNVLHKLLVKHYNGSKQVNVDMKLLMIVAAVDGAAKLVLSGPRVIQRDSLLKELKEAVVKIID